MHPSSMLSVRLAPAKSGITASSCPERTPPSTTPPRQPSVHSQGPEYLPTYSAATAGQSLPAYSDAKASRSQPQPQPRSTLSTIKHILSGNAHKHHLAVLEAAATAQPVSSRQQSKLDAQIEPMRNQMRFN